MTAGRKKCERLESAEGETVKMQGALKPVSPKEDPIEREGLSQNGDTAERQEESEMEDESSQEATRGR